MAKTRKIGIVNLKIVIKKLQKNLLLSAAYKKSSSDFEDFEEVNESTYVPEDVKEGHFAVIAVDDYELKRFVIPLSFLTHPIFLKLLEQAAEEYGFDHDGALTIPCRPSELERILAEQWDQERGSKVNFGANNWSGSCNKNMVKSC